MISYETAIVSIALSYIIFEIFDEYSGLEM